MSCSKWFFYHTVLETLFFKEKKSGVIRKPVPSFGWNFLGPFTRFFCAKITITNFSPFSLQYFKNVRSNNVLQLKQIFQKKCGRRSKQFKCALTNSNFDRAIQNVNSCCNHSHNKRCLNSCNRVSTL